MTTPDIRRAAVEFLKDNVIGVLATTAPGGHPRARTVYYAANDSFEVFFMTLRNTRKVEDLGNDGRAAFVVSDSKTPKTLQIEGSITELTDSAVIDPIVKELMDTFTSHGFRFAPLAHLHASALSYYKITPTWIRFGDFTTGQGEENVFSTIETGT